MDNDFNLILYLSDLFYSVASGFYNFFVYCSQYTLNELLSEFGSSTNWLWQIIFSLIEVIVKNTPFGDSSLLEFFFVTGLLYFVMFNLVKWLNK